MPREEQARLQEREILGFLEQSRISEKNVKPLGALAESKVSRIARLAVLVSDIAELVLHRPRRTRTLARDYREVLKRMERVGLILPLPGPMEVDPTDVDRVADWRE